jgi:hypothetical protein
MFVPEPRRMPQPGQAYSTAPIPEALQAPLPPAPPPDPAEQVLREVLGIFGGN